MKKNLTKIIMLALTLCMMIAVFAVVASAKTNISAVAVTNNPAKYTGSVQDPVLKAYNNGTELGYGTDFRIKSVSFVDTFGENAYTNKKPADMQFKNAGIYRITVEGCGDNYKGSVEVVYEIKQASNNIENFAASTNNYVVDSVYGETVKDAIVKAKFGRNTTEVKYYTKADFEAGNMDVYTTTRPKNAGTYVIYYKVNETANYKGVEGKWEITISPKTIGISVDDSTKVYGTADPDEFTFTGELNSFVLTKDQGKVSVELKRVAGKNVGEYKINATLVGDAAANYKLPDDVAGTFTITPAPLTVTLKELAGYMYGDIVDFGAFYTVEGLIDGDNVSFDVDLEDEVLHAGANWFTVVAEGDDFANYALNVVGTDGEFACFALAKRVLKVADFAVKEQLYYNGQLQSPEIIVKPEALATYGDYACVPEIIGSSRKYGGTYSVTVVALSNENYTIEGGEAKVEYTILAEGEKNSDNAVGEFLAGVINAGEIAGEVVEVVAPVVNAIGKVIIDGIKNGVSALLNDFIGRVFA